MATAIACELFEPRTTFWEGWDVSGQIGRIVDWLEQAGRAERIAESLLAAMAAVAEPRSSDAPWIHPDQRDWLLGAAVRAEIAVRRYLTAEIDPGEITMGLRAFNWQIIRLADPPRTLRPSDRADVVQIAAHTGILRARLQALVYADQLRVVDVKLRRFSRTKEVERIMTSANASAVMA